MSKFATLFIIIFFIGTQSIYCQNPTGKQAVVIGRTNDWEGLFTNVQKSKLDSVSVLFAYKTNIAISVITFGAANTTQEGSDAFVDHIDSMMFQNNNDAPVMGIFLSKDFRVLNFQVHKPAGTDTSKLTDWKIKMKQIFTSCAQPYIPLLKDGKYADALIASISDLAVAVKKEM